MSHVLNDSDQRTLAALADRIVPGDDFPSAAESGAVAFVCGLLDRDLTQRWPELLDGLAGLDAAAKKADGESFANLSPARQDALLAALESGTDAAARQFFAWLVELVVEGYYADPANGGNRGAASWTMVGYDPRVPGYDPHACEDDGVNIDAGAK